MTESESQQRTLYRILALAALVALAGCAGVSARNETTTDEWADPSVTMELRDDLEGHSCVLGLNETATEFGDADALIVEKGSTEYRYDSGDLNWFGPVRIGTKVRVWAERGEWRKEAFSAWVAEDCSFVSEKADREDTDGI